MYRLTIEENFLVITESSLALEHIRHPLGASTFNVLETDDVLNPIIRFTGLTAPMLVHSGGNSEFRFSELEDEDGLGFNVRAEFIEFLSLNLGSKGGGGGGSGGSGGSDEVDPAVLVAKNAEYLKYKNLPNMDTIHTKEGEVILWKDGEEIFWV